MATAVKEKHLQQHERTGPQSEKGSFSDWVQVYGKALRHYCRFLTGSAWEGDDLAQDTWLKIWSAARGKGQSFRLTRTYLYRTAQHAWIDRGRKKRLTAEPLPVEELLQAPGQTDAAAVWAAVETMVSELSPLQRTAFLLIEILQYTAGEAAQLIHSTEGAVKAALHRARVRLRNAVESSSRREGGDNSDGVPIVEETAFADASHEILVHAYLDAVRREDAAALAMLFNDVRPQDVVPVLTLQSYRRSSLRGKSSTPVVDPVESRLTFFAFGHAA